MRLVVLFSYNLFLAFSAVPKQESIVSALGDLVQTETLQLSLLIAEFEAAYKSVCEVAKNLAAPDKSSLRYGAKLFFLQTVCTIFVERFDYKIASDLEDLLNVQALERFTLETYSQFGKSIDNIRKAIEIGDRKFLKKLTAGNLLVVASTQFASKLIEIHAKTDAGTSVQEELLKRVTQALMVEFDDSSSDELGAQSARQCHLVQEFFSNCHQSILELQPLDIPGLDLFVGQMEMYRSTSMATVETLCSGKDLNSINDAQRLVSIAYTDIFGLVGCIQEYMLENAMSFVKSLAETDPVRLTALKFLSNVATFIERAGLTFDAQEKFRRKVLTAVIEQAKAGAKQDTTVEVTDSVAKKNHHRKKKGKKNVSKESVAVLATDEPVPVSATVEDEPFDSPPLTDSKTIQPDSATEGWAVIAEPVHAAESDTVLSAVPVVPVPAILPFSRPWKWHKNWADYSSSSEDGSEDDELPEEETKVSVAPAPPAVNAWAKKLVIAPEATATGRQQARRMQPAASATAQKSTPNVNRPAPRTVPKGGNALQVNTRTTKPW